jgi:hypothetical protein
MYASFKTLEEIDAEVDVQVKRLVLVEADLEKLHDKEWEIRTALTHLAIQRARLENIPNLV